MYIVQPPHTGMNTLALHVTITALENNFPVTYIRVFYNASHQFGLFV